MRAFLRTRWLFCLALAFGVSLQLVEFPQSAQNSDWPKKLRRQIDALKEKPNGRDIQMLLEAQRSDVADDLQLHWQDGPWGNTLRSLRALFAGDYGRAQASAADPLPAQMLWLRKYLADLPAARTRFDKVESEHFVFFVLPEERFLIPYAQEAMEQARAVLGERFGLLPQDKIRVEIYPTRQRFSAASTLSEEILKRSGAIGIAKFNRLMILSPKTLPFGYRWLDALVHEYTHLLINRISDGNCPLWLHEGVARYHDTLWRQDPPLFLTPAAENQLAVAVSSGSLISFRRMSPSMVYLDNQQEVSLAFAQVSHTVSYIVEHHGIDAIRRLLTAFRERDQSGSFKASVGMVEDKLEAAWRTSLGKAQLTRTQGAPLDLIRFDARDEIEEFVGADLHGLVRLGDKFRRRGQPRVALVQYQKALKKEPDNPVILNKLARAQLDLGNVKEAEEYLRRSTEKNPNYVTTRVWLGEVLFQQDRLDEALPHYQEANALNPFHPVIHKRQALIYAGRGESERFAVEYQASRQVTPADRSLDALAKGRSDELYRNALEDYLDGRKKDAIDKCVRALVLNPTNAECRRLIDRAGP